MNPGAYENVIIGSIFCPWGLILPIEQMHTSKHRKGNVMEDRVISMSQSMPEIEWRLLCLTLWPMACTVLHSITIIYEAWRAWFLVDGEQ